MNLKRCRELSKDKRLIHSNASYIKLLDYAERLEAERAAIVPAIEACRQKITPPLNKLSIGGKIFNSGLGAAIKAVNNLQQVGNGSKQRNEND